MSPRPVRRPVARGSEVIRVREEAPPVRSVEQLVARPGVSDYLPIYVERIPVYGRKDRVLAELAGVDLTRHPLLSLRRPAIGVDGRGEVSQDGAGVRHVNRLSPSDRKERRVTETDHTFHIA